MLCIRFYGISVYVYMKFFQYHVYSHVFLGLGSRGLNEDGSGLGPHKALRHCKIF